MNKYIKHYDLLDIDYLDLEEYTENNATEVVDMQLIKNYYIVEYVDEFAFDLSELYIFAIHIVDEAVKKNNIIEYGNNVKQYSDLFPSIMREYNQSKEKSGLWAYINKTMEEIYYDYISDPMITFEQLMTCLD